MKYLKRLPNSLLFLVFCLSLLFLLSGFFSDTASAATTRKTITMPSNGNLFSNGISSTLGDVLSVVELAPGVEYIPNGASANRGLATLSKGVSTPVSGILSGLKSGLKANAGSLALNAVIASAVAGVGWIIDNNGALVKVTPGGKVQTDPNAGQVYWQYSGSPKFSSAGEGCDAFGVSIAAPQGLNTSTNTLTVNGSSASCKVTTTQLGGSTNLTKFNTACPTGSTYSATVGACLSNTSSQSPVLDSDMSVLDGFVRGKDGTWQRGLVDGVCKGSTNYDACIVAMGGKPTLTGPATVTLPSTTTQTQTQNPDGSSTQTTAVTNTQYGLTYGVAPSPYVDMTPNSTTTTTTTTKNSQGVVTSTTTSTSTTSTPASSDPAPEPTYDYADPDFPPVKPFYTQKYPDGFPGVWNKNKATFDSTPFMTFLHSFVPSFSGSCPTWSLSFDIMPHAHFGSGTFGNLCYIFDFVKVIMLVTAMFTCRAIIFGG